MLGWKSSSWFYPKPTGDPGRDRNARTLQFSCFLLALAVCAVMIVSAIDREWQEMPLLVFGVTGFVAAAVLNRAGRSDWGGRTAFLIVLMGAILLVFHARDGFRSHSMLFFPGLLLISVMMLDRGSYVTTAGIVVVTVAALGIAVKHGLTRATPPLRTTYDSIFYVDLNLLVVAIIGGRIVRDTGSNLSALHAMNDQLSAANIALTESAHALRQSEAKYRRLHESITDAVVTVDLNGHILETNGTFQSMLGYAGEELRGSTYQELTPERWHDFEAQIVAEQVLARGHSQLYEKEYRRRDGTVFPVELRRYLLHDESDRPIGMWAIVHDISGRKRDKDAIAEGEQRLRIAKDAAKLGIYQYDVAAGTILWDARVRQFWGVGPDEPITIETFLSGLHPDDRAKTQALLDHALDPAGSGEYYAEYRVISRADGIERWIGASGHVFFEDGRAVRMIGAGQDISERKRAEAALRESEERFRRVFEDGPLGLALIGKDYRFEKVNSALCRMLGYSEVELLRLSFVDITHPDDVQTDVHLAEQLFKREIPFYRIHKRYVKKSGEIIWINLTASIILGPNGEPLHGLGMVEDITEIKHTQEETLFHQKLESVGTLAGGIAHDFNNLLGAIQAQTELAMASMDAGASCREELKVISNVAIRGSEIVRQLMIYAGKENAVVGSVDVSKTVDEMLSLLNVSVTKRALIQTDLQHDLPTIQASTAHIAQVVMNLITNASDAIRERDGQIRLITRRFTLKGQPTAIALPDGDYVQLEVTDNGCGMSPQTQAKVFDPFFTTKSAGRGLGLAVVQGIVRSLGGAIQLTSEPNRGTTFRIFLPCAKTKASASQREMSGLSGGAGLRQHATILFVEDEGSLRQPVAKVLSKNGFEVLEAADGTSAIDLLRTNAAGIDVLLLDMTIPGASSLEVLQAAVDVRPDIRVILTSAYSQEMIEGSMRAPQIRGFIRKPFQLEELLKMLRSSSPS